MLKREGQIGGSQRPVQDLGLRLVPVVCSVGYGCLAGHPALLSRHRLGGDGFGSMTGERDWRLVARLVAAEQLGKAVAGRM
ncbi:MAG: hypothetical protein JO049_28795 [Hyphomicrobiales bacterium]|nr:hypothetical protein [Hyphomicrobiales bacterium]